MTLSERFDSKVSPEPTSGCHLWIGDLHRQGYGRLWVNHQFKRAHHVAWFLQTGAWPKQLNHRCDVPVCVNPGHLYEGNQAQNSEDQLVRGRHASASRTECPNGHPYSGFNLYVSPNGKRHCRTCRYAATQEWRDKRKAN